MKNKEIVFIAILIATSMIMTIYSSIRKESVIPETTGVLSVEPLTQTDIDKDVDNSTPEPILTPKPVLKTAMIESSPKPTPRADVEAEVELSEGIALSSESRELVALVCETEDNLHGLDGLTAIASTIRNRLEDGRFGASIESVCIVSQFHGLERKGSVSPSEDAYSAVEAVFSDDYDDITNGGLYFCTPSTNPSRIKSGLRATAEIGGHIFYTDIPEN